MAQNKNKKPKARKPQRDAVKKFGKKAYMGEFRTQLDALGLKIVELTADGNCFFRLALADQLEGNEEGHMKYRAMVVQYIVSHREDFEPFIEDEVPFDEYCQSMEKDGTWAGHMELQAASLVTKRNICIHMLNFPRWYISNFSGHEANMIHLSYHDGEHYNSVRLKEDPCQGPAMPVTIKVDTNISKTSKNPQSKAKQLKKSSHRSPCDYTSVKLVMAGTGCSNIAAVEQVLREVDGDVDVAIEYMIAEQLASDSNYADGNSFMDNACHGDELSKCYGELENPMVGNKHEESSSSKAQTVRESDSLHVKKERSKNKECSCGSARKHKASCSSAMEVPSTAPVRSKGAQGKGQKGKKQKKKAQAEVVPLRESGALPDFGALCI